MTTKKHALQTLAALSFVAFSMQSANAASQDECAIWLCAPGGFPEGCSAAKSAMIKREGVQKSVSVQSKAHHLI